MKCQVIELCFRAFNLCILFLLYFVPIFMQFLHLIKKKKSETGSTKMESL